MSEQDPKDAPVGAGLGEQDAYARGVGSAINELLIELKIATDELQRTSRNLAVLRARVQYGADLVVSLTPRKLPSRGTVADSLLIFVTDPDAAEVLVGDLIEKMTRVRKRKSAFLTWIWFWWQVFWIACYQGLARVKDKTVLGNLGEAIIKRIGG